MSAEILLIIAFTGYQVVEYNNTKQELEKAGFTVVTASNRTGIATANDEKTKTKVDITLDKVDVHDYDGIYFIGGPGALENLDNNASYKIIKDAIAAKKPVGAICISPRILAKTGLLKGKKATGWDGDNELVGVFKKFNVIYEPKKVVVDGSIITATDPSAATDFGKAIVIYFKNLKK